MPGRRGGSGHGAGRPSPRRLVSHCAGVEVGDAVQVSDELISNACRHARSPRICRLRVDYHDSGKTVWAELEQPESAGSLQIMPLWGSLRSRERRQIGRSVLLGEFRVISSAPASWTWRMRIRQAALEQSRGSTSSRAHAAIRAGGGSSGGAPGGELRGRRLVSSEWLGAVVGDYGTVYAGPSCTGVLTASIRLSGWFSRIRGTSRVGASASGSSVRGVRRA